MRHRPAIIACWLLCLLAPGQGQAWSGDDDPYLPFVILSPPPDSSVKEDEPLEISLLLEKAPGLELRLFLDSLDITSQSQITEDYIFYLSPAPPSAGRHYLSVLLLSQADTVIFHRWTFLVPAAETAGPYYGPPLELAVNCGLYGSLCSRDTTGLGLASPAGWLPLGSAHFSSQLWAGRVFSHLSYDPAYDRSPHGLVQYDREAWELSLGEFYPDLSSLAFSGPSPLGLMVSHRSRGLRLQAAAGRTQAADTLFQTYEQHLYGGQADLGAWGTLKLTTGFLYGWDRPSSLPDSVRFRTDTYIYDDTLTGLADTLITVDTLVSGNNHLWWLAAAYGRESLRWRAEAARSGFRPDIGGSYLGDRSFLLGVERQAGRHSLDVRYLSWGEHYKSFGNPYLESAKNELLWTLIWRRSFISSQTDGSLYRVFTDSSGGNSFRAGGSLSLSPPDHPSINLRADYHYRPYRWYIYTSRSLSLGAAGRASRFGWQTSLAYSSNTGVSSGQSCNIRLSLSRRMMEERLIIQGAAAHYWTGWDSGLPTQDRISGNLRAELQVSGRANVSLELRQLSQWDRTDPLKTYNQRTAVLSLGYRW
jgi:hypothetical protein